MLIKKASEVPAQAMQEGIGIRWLIAEKEGAPNFAMREIELQPGVVFTLYHHPYEHEIYVLEGEGVITNPDGDVGALRPGVFVFVPPDEIHGYRNTGDRPLKFICVIPLPKQG